MNKLTPKQEMFCKEYLIDLNANQAAIRAGYSEQTAHVIGPENLVKPCVSTRLGELLKERQDRTEVTADMVIKELAVMAFSNKDNHPEYMRDKKGCLELLSKHFGLLKDGMFDNLPEGTYVQIYRPEAYSKKEIESSLMVTNRHG